MELHKAYKLNFKLDDEGRTIWFPYSYFSKGYILTDEAEEEIIRVYRNPMQLVWGLLVILFTDLILFAAWQSLLPVSELMFVVLLVSPVVPIMIWVRIWSNRVAANLAVSPVKITFREWLEHQLLEQYSRLVTFSMVSCFFLVFFSIYVMWENLTWTPGSPWSKPSIAWSVLPLGLAALHFFFCRYLMRLKRRHDRKERS